MKEKELESILEKKLEVIESGLSLIEKQKHVDMGIVDLFYKDKNNNYAIFNDLVTLKLVTVEKIGGSKLVRLKKR